MKLNLTTLVYEKQQLIPLPKHSLIKFLKENNINIVAVLANNYTVIAMELPK